MIPVEFETIQLDSPSCAIIVVIHTAKPIETTSKVVKIRSIGVPKRQLKNINTGAPYTHKILVLPTRNMTEADSAYAVSFAIPIDAPGVELVSRRGGTSRRFWRSSKFPLWSTCNNYPSPMLDKNNQ